VSTAIQDLIFNIGRELLQVITLVKVAVAISMVVILSLIAEFVSPRFAGIIAGYPPGEQRLSCFYRIRNERSATPTALRYHSVTDDNAAALMQSL
jgi:hypothetical protein